MIWTELLVNRPLVAILRGVEPGDAAEVAQALHDGGIRCVEATLNSPSPFASIEAIADRLGGEMLVGAGTVLAPAGVRAAAAAGARLIISPNTDEAVIGESKALGLISLPGFFTPSEAFTALRAGADALKFFPAEAGGPSTLRAMAAVLPREIPLFAVGGVDPAAVAAWRAAGASGLGIGSAIYRPGMALDEITARAAAFVAAWL